jgi:hypothetical protein
VSSEDLKPFKRFPPSPKLLITRLKPGVNENFDLFLCKASEIRDQKSKPKTPHPKHIIHVQSNFITTELVKNGLLNSARSPGFFPGIKNRRAESGL